MNLKPIYVDLPQLLQLVPLSESTLQKEQREGRFPRPRTLSGRRVAWLVTEVEEWAANRPHSDLPPPPNTGAPKPRGPRGPRRQGRHAGAPALPAAHPAE